jgi:hypothetical protein
MSGIIYVCQYFNLNCSVLFLARVTQGYLLVSSTVEVEKNAPRRTTAARRVYSSSKCAVCRHDERWRIELLKAGGASLDALAAKFGVSRDSIDRHWHRHVSLEARASYLIGPGEMATIGERAIEESDSVLDYLKMCRTTLVGQLAAANEVGDARGAAFVVNALVRTLEALARVSGEVGTLATSITFNNNTNIAMVNHPQFASVQATLLRALAPFADARAAVVAALRGLDGANAPSGPAAPAMKVIEHVAA